MTHNDWFQLLFTSAKKSSVTFFRLSDDFLQPAKTGFYQPTAIRKPYKLDRFKELKKNYI
jgi:hypothetical protein